MSSGPTPEPASSPSPAGAAAPERSLSRDVVWNFASLAVLGVSGIALNILIVEHYDEDALGVFNQVLATYTIFSMLAAGGINLSALRGVAAHAGDRRTITSIVVGALLPTVALAALSTAIYWASRGTVARILESDAVAVGLEASTPGLFFFAINKVLLSIVNGFQRMRAFAIYQALRYLLILLGLVGFLVLDVERAHGNELAFVFSFAEGVLCVPLAIEVLRRIAFPIDAAWRRWCATHVRYGVKSVASGILLELNAKTDVWMIGIFMGDGDVGVYTIAAMVAEGVYQLLVVLQNVYNPILARKIAAGELDALHAMIVVGKRRTYAGMLAVSIVAVMLYPHAIELLTDKPGLLASWLPFGILIGGILLASGYVPFGQTLLMAGRPGWHTLYMVLAVALNVACDVFLIPAYGLVGAAASTALSMVAAVVLLRAFVRRQTGLRL